MTFFKSASRLLDPDEQRKQTPNSTTENKPVQTATSQSAAQQSEASAAPRPGGSSSK